MLLSVSEALGSLRGDRPSPQRLTGPIGVEIGTDAVKLCQLRTHDATRFDVVASASAVFSGPRTALLDDRKRLRTLLRQAVRRRGFVGRRAVAAMPPDRVKFMPITFRGEQASVADAVLKALAGRVDGDLADHVIDYLPVRSGADQDESLVLAAVARRDHVTALLDALDDAGLRVDALDIGPAAIRRLVSVFHVEDGVDETILVLNTGGVRSYLSVISGRRLLFDQAVDFGEQLLLDDLAKALDLDVDSARALVIEHGLEAGADDGSDDDPTHPDVAGTLREIVKHRFVELVDEINRILVFTAAETRGQPISRVCVFGGVARWAGAGELLRELVDMPASAGARRLDDFFIDAGGTHGGECYWVPDMAVAIGLALRGVIGND